LAAQANDGYAHSRVNLLDHHPRRGGGEFGAEHDLEPLTIRVRFFEADGNSLANC